MNQIPRGNPKILIICGIFMFMLLFIIQNPANAFENGTGDLDTSCTGCHVNGGLGTVNVITLPDTMETDQANIDFSVTVNIDSADSDGNFAGIMLLTGTDENIKNAGWDITSNPNNNEYPYNYNERAGLSGDTMFTWTLTAPPTVDNYTIKARILYEDGGANFLESQGQIISVVASQPSENNELGKIEGGESQIIDMEALRFGALVGISSVMIVMILRRRYYE